MTEQTRSSPSAPHRFAFAVEQGLGHRTHYRNLQRFVAEDATVSPCWLPLQHGAPALLGRLPLLRSNVALRTSASAAQGIALARRSGPLHAVLYHTQTASLMSALHPRLPTVISLDATPINFDAVGRAYGHASGGWLEPLKLRWYRDVFRRADALVTWCQWAKDSLQRDYGVPREKISVIAPGIDLGRWPRRSGRERDEARRGRLPRLLFVGGDFARKGGELLLECFRARLERRCELHVVTQSPVLPGPRLHVHRGLAPNSDELVRLFAEADVFVFPTLGDCFPQVVPEAMAAGLPVVTTRVGATPESVVEGETGLLVEPGDALALCAAIEALLERPELRVAMGNAGRKRAEATSDARLNAGRILEILKAVSARRIARNPRPSASTV